MPNSVRLRLLAGGVRLRSRAEALRLLQQRRVAARALLTLWELEGGECGHGVGEDQDCPGDDEGSCAHQGLRPALRDARRTVRAKAAA